MPLLNNKIPNWEMNVLETLSGSFYLAEEVFSNLYLSNKNNNKYLKKY
jgi:hypothetical protein